MTGTVIELTPQELMRVESILMDEDEQEALLFLKEVIRPKIREKGATAIDSSKSIGIKT